MVIRRFVFNLYLLITLTIVVDIISKGDIDPTLTKKRLFVL